MELTSAMEHEIDELGRALVEGEFESPDKIYLDLSLVKDFNIGTLLTLIEESDNAEVLYTRMMHGLDAYNERSHLDVMAFFEDLKISRDQFFDRFNDPKYGPRILARSPMTTFLTKFFTPKLNDNIRNSSIVGKTDPIRLHVNTYPLKGLTDSVIMMLGILFSRRFGVEVEIINVDLPSLDLESLFDYDQFFIQDFYKVSQRDDFRTSLTNADFKFFSFLFKKSIFCPPYIFKDGKEAQTSLYPYKDQLTMGVATYRSYLSEFDFIHHQYLSVITGDSAEGAIDG